MTALINKGYNNLSDRDKNFIDKEIANLINVYKDNNGKMNKFALESISALNANEARMKGLMQQGFFARLLNNINGNKRKTLYQVEENRNKVLYASQRIIECLRNENLLSLELIAAINNKFNGITLKVNKEITDILELIYSVKKDSLFLHKDLKKTQNDIKLLKWLYSLKSIKRNGILYPNLNFYDKLTFLSFDFADKTAGQWTNEDLIILRNCLEDVNLNPEEKISLADYYFHMAEKIGLNKMFLEGVILKKIDFVENYNAPLIKSLVRLYGLEKDKKKDKLSLIRDFLIKNNRDPDFELEIFDFMLDLLLEISIIHSAEKPKKRIVANSGMVIVQSGRTSKNNTEISLANDLEVAKYPVTTAEFMKFLNNYKPGKDGNYKGRRLIKISSPYSRIKYKAASFYIDGKATAGRHPIVYVSWYGALAYCNYLSKKKGLPPAYSEDYWDLFNGVSLQDTSGYRLPSQKEWEYIARGGKRGKASKYAGSNKLEEVGWSFGDTDINANPYYSNGLATMPVGEKNPNELGIYDLSGNVWEWTASETDEKVVVKGGSWRGNISSCTIKNFKKFNKDLCSNTVGFRVIRVIK